jgi:regulation of enolase protein 1 (concanavalin A-like superfamily)
LGAATKFSRWQKAFLLSLGIQTQVNSICARKRSRLLVQDSISEQGEEGVMRTRVLLLLVCAALLVGCIPVWAAVDKAVYRDENYALSWTTAEVADMITNYLVSKGYRKLDAQGFREFCLQHIKDRATSVVVMANDVIPDTVADPIGDTYSPNPNSTLNRYLRNGGKLIYLFDWPGYYVALSDGTRPAWNDTGAAAAFGFWVARWGSYADINAPVVFTEEGKKWGLTKPWISKRATSPSDVDIVLGNPAGRSDVAMPWVKTYVWGRPGAGMIYLYDLPAGDAVAGGFNDEDLAQIDRVATYFPAGETKLYGIEGVVTDESGKPIASGKIKVLGPEGTMTVAVAADGTYAAAVPEGEYTLILDNPDYGAEAIKVKVDSSTPVIKKDISASKLPSMSLGTADGYSWLIWRGGSIFDFAPADPAFKVTNEWVNTEIPSDAEVRELNGAYFWYRTKFNIPADWGKFNRGLIIERFSVEDSDWTFFNGHFIGNTKWLTEGPRRYFIPMEWVNFGGENLLVVKGQHGNDTAGMNRNAPLLHLAPPMVGGVLVTAKEPGTGYPALNATVTLSTLSGKLVASDLVREAGYVMFSEVPVGEYKVTLQPAPAIAGVKPESITVKVESGKVAEAVFTPTLLPLVLPGNPTPYDDDFSGTALDKKWTSVEIGDAGGSSATVRNGQLVITGAGANIFGNEDNFHFVYQKIKGDFSVSVKVVTVPALHVLSKAALMIRASEDKDAANAVVYQSPTQDQQYGCRFQWRPTKGATTNGGTVNMDQPGTREPTWLCLRREGKRITGYFSVDGKVASLVQGADVTIDELPDEVLVGVGWASRGDVGDAVFDDFTVRPIVTVPPTPAVVLGDVNGDGKVGIPDATLALQMAVGKLQPTSEQLAAGDLNKNGRIDIPDVTKILRAAIGLEKLS